MEIMLVARRAVKLILIILVRLVPLELLFVICVEMVLFNCNKFVIMETNLVAAKIVLLMLDIIAPLSPMEPHSVLFPSAEMASESPSKNAIMVTNKDATAV